MTNKKPNTVKIIQIIKDEVIHYTSTGSMYKDKETETIFYGLGDDGNVYQYKKHWSVELRDELYWKLITL